MIKKLNKSSAGKRGDSVRSDCYFEIELKEFWWNKNRSKKQS